MICSDHIQEMKVIEIKLLSNAGGSINCRITDIDKDNTNYEFQHPLNGGYSNSIMSCFSGWSEQDEEAEIGWHRIISFVNSIETWEKMLDDLYWSDRPNLTFLVEDYLFEQIQLEEKDVTERIAYDRSMRRWYFVGSQYAFTLGEPSKEIIESCHMDSIVNKPFGNSYDGNELKETILNDLVGTYFLIAEHEDEDGFVFEREYEKRDYVPVEETIELSDFEIRIYEDGEFILMKEGYDARTESDDFAVLNDEQYPDFDFSRYMSETHEVQTDKSGDKYTVWENSQLDYPFTLENVLSRIKYYEELENEYSVELLTGIILS